VPDVVRRLQPAGAAAAAGPSVWSRLARLGTSRDAGEAANALLQGRAAGRAEEANYDLDYDRLALLRAQQESQRAREGVDADLAQRRYQNENYQRNAGNAVRGGYLQGVQDVNIQAPSTIPRANITGGARPSAILNARQMGQQIQGQALEALAQPQNTSPLPSYNPAPLPSLSTPPRPGPIDTGLNWAAVLSPLADAYLRRGRGGTTLPAAPTAPRAPRVPLPATRF